MAAPSPSTVAAMNDTLRIALIAVAAIMAARLILPHVPVLGPTVSRYL